MATGKSGGAASATPASMAVKVVIQPSAGTDGQLLYDAVQLTSNKSGLIGQLAMRGWLNLLHGTPPVERSIQLRMIGLPDDVIAQIDAAIPNPHFLGLDGREASETSPAAVSRAEHLRPAQRPTERKKSAPQAQPTSAAADPAEQGSVEQTSDRQPGEAPYVPAELAESSPQVEPKRIFQPPEKSRLGDPFAGGGLA